MPSLCNKCAKNVTDKRFPGLSCANCNKIFHISCANLQQDSFKNIVKNQLAWSCSNCKNKSSTRKSGIFPSTSAAQNTQVSAASTNDNLLQDLIDAFNNYRITTDERIKQLENIVAEKSQQVEALKESVQKVEVTAEEIVQQTASNSLEVQGVPDEELSSPTESVLQIASEIGCALIAQDFDCSTLRSGSKPVIAIKFNSSEIRRNFLHAGKQFNRDKKRVKFANEEIKIFVNEQLTSAQKKLLYNTKSFAREQKYNFAWFCNGVVHLKKQDNSELIIIRSQIDLDILSENEAQIILSERERPEIQDERASSGSQVQRL